MEREGKKQCFVSCILEMHFKFVIPSCLENSTEFQCTVQCLSRSVANLQRRKVEVET